MATNPIRLPKSVSISDLLILTSIRDLKLKILLRDRSNSTFQQLLSKLIEVSDSRCSMDSLEFQKRIQKRLDQVAIAFSGLCTIHCLLTPVLFIFFPVLSSTFVTGEDFHYLFLWFVLPVSLFALLLGYFRRRDKMALLLGAIGLSQLVAAAIFGNGFFSEFSEVVVTSLGSLILITGHIRNYQLCCCDECQT
ncbi:MAG: MerC domain-containing protein (plasmid) [Phormidium sp.]